MEIDKEAAGQSADLHIPEEICRAIMTRLPTKSVLRFRGACKSWNLFVRDKLFAQDHHPLQKTQLLIVPVDPGNTRRRIHHRVDAIDLQQIKQGSRPIVRHTTDGLYDTSVRAQVRNYQTNLSAVLGSIDGLLLLSLDQKSYICNPATRESRRLPELDNEEVWGFYKVDDSFRVLYVKENEEDPEEFCILSVDHFEIKNRTIAYCPVSPAEKMTDDFGRRKLRCSLDYSALQPPAFVGGNLYWPPIQVSVPLPEPEITVFDCQLELFHWIKAPKASNTMRLLNLDGKLGMAISQRGESLSELWVLDSQMWERRYNIELPVAELTRFGALTWSSFVISMEGDVIVRCVRNKDSGSGDEQQQSDVLLHCDKHGKLAQGSLFEGILAVRAIHLLQESMVRHEFFQMNQGNASTPSPLFQDL